MIHQYRIHCVFGIPKDLQIHIHFASIFRVLELNSHFILWGMEENRLTHQFLIHSSLRGILLWNDKRSSDKEELYFFPFLEFRKVYTHISNLLPCLEWWNSEIGVPQYGTPKLEFLNIHTYQSSLCRLYRVYGALQDGTMRSWAPVLTSTRPHTAVLSSPGHQS